MFHLLRFVGGPLDGLDTWCRERPSEITLKEHSYEEVDGRFVCQGRWRYAQVALPERMGMYTGVRFRNYAELRTKCDELVRREIVTAAAAEDACKAFKKKMGVED